MSAGDKVSYTKLEAINEIFPDDPSYVWEGRDTQPEGVEERMEAWFNFIKDKFESFEHDKKSSIYRAYGHDYDDPKQRTIKMPNGSTPGGNYTYMIDELKDALRYRIENFGGKNAGWDVFKKITGRYEVEAVDMTVLAERDSTLRRFLSIINEDEALTTIDPLTGKEAITDISPEGTMSPIEYMFPMGLEDTDFIHYTVYAPEVIEAKIEGDEQVEDFIKFEVASKVAHTGEAIQPKRAIGVVMGPHGKVLRPFIRVIQEKIGGIVDEVNAILDSDGVEGVTEYFKDIELPNTDTVINSDKLVETFKRIKVADLINKITDKALKKRVNRIKPPSDGKAAGVSWPESAGGNFNLWLTTDPFEMLTKSTGRKWSERNASCENWDGCYSAGPMSDIKYGNLIVWVYKGEDTAYRNELGRFILRWGDAVKDGNKIGRDIGVEAQVYPKSNAPWGFNLLGAIGMILKDAGYLNYDSCRTPYVYKGYTDRGGSGNVRITYDSRVVLKGQGEVDVGGANALVTMASNENLSYADSGYILNYGNAQALLALAQNPMVWIYENTIRRLFTRAIDLDEGPQIAQFLVQSSVANYDWMTGVLDLLPILDPNHSDATKESLSTFMLKNANCSDFAQDAIIGNHPLMVGDGIEFPITHIAYLNTFQRNWVDSMTVNFESREAFATNASADILSELVSEVTKARFGEYDAGIIQIMMVLNRDAPADAGAVSFRINPLFVKRYLKMKAIVALMNQPKLSLRDFAKLLTSFDKMYRKDYDKAMPKHQEILNNIKRMFVRAFAFPLQSRTNWGYKMPQFQNIPAVLRNMTLIVDGEEINYPIYSRQSVGVFRRIYDLLLLDNSPTDINDRLLILRNIRDGGVFREAVSDSNIPRKYLIRRMQDPNDLNSSIVNPFLNVKTYTDIVSTMTLEDFKEYFIDYEVEGGEIVRREAVPEKVLNKILSSPDLVSAIRWSAVGRWLTTSKQFKTFEKMVYSATFGSLYRRNGSFEYYSDGVDLEEDFFLILDIEEKMADSNILFTAATGLAQNQSVPEELQMKILRTWSDIATYYSIPYDESIYVIAYALSKNPNVSGEAIQEIMDNFATTDNDIFTNIISNARVTVGDDMIKAIMQDNPLVLLKNYNLNIRSYRRIFKDALKVIETPVTDDPERFQKGWDSRARARRFSDPYYVGQGSSMLRQWQSYLQELDWIRYWRGGTFKKALKLPSAPYNSAPMNQEKGRPQALVDEPVLIDYPQVIFTCDGEKDDDGNFTFTNITYKFIKDILVNDDGSITVIANIWSVDEGNESFDTEGEQTLRFEDVNAMYGFIPEDRRANPDVKWNHGIILVIFDETSPQGFTTLPDWRMQMTGTKLKEAVKDFLGNPKITDEDLDFVTDFALTGRTYTSNQDSFRYNIVSALDEVDRLNLWTPEYIDKYSKSIFGVANMYNYENLLPTAKCFDYSLAASENPPIEEDEALKYAEFFNEANSYFGGRGFTTMQEWILGERYRDIIPIIYVYECIVGTQISAEIKTKARTVRDRRLAEYLNFVRRDENPEVNDAEEMHPYEWRTYNSEMSSILLTYCEKMYPHDPFMQEQLMESIIRGNSNVSLEQMAKTVRGE